MRSDAEPTASIHVACADGWTLGQESIWSASQPRIHRAAPEASTTADLHCGSCRVAELGAVLASFERRLEAAQKVKNEKRTAASGQQGHQRTGAWVASVVRDALEQTKVRWVPDV